MRAVWLAVMVLMAMPAAAQECFSGRAGKVTYDNGRVITIIQRHGSDVTYTQPYTGFQDAVSKSHLMLFPKTSRAGARSTEYRWSSALPKIGQLVPGYRFDLKGTMKSGSGKALPYRNAGEVVGQETLAVGACNYAVMVVRTVSYLGDQEISVSTDYLSPDLQIVLRSDMALTSGAKVSQTAVAID